jgi:hypothetical protein
MTPSKTQPALLGGLFIGVLSALPVVNLGNCCCCLWVVCGGALAAWLLQQNTPEPMATSDAMIAGLLAGLVGAVAGALIAIPVQYFTGPMFQGLVDQLVANSADLPEEFRDAFEQARQGQGGSFGLTLAVGFVWFLVSLVFYAAFATVGGALGAVFFRRPGAPVNAPPPSFTPPPPPQF